MWLEGGLKVNLVIDFGYSLALAKPNNKVRTLFMFIHISTPGNFFHHILVLPWW